MKVPYHRHGLGEGELNSAWATFQSGFITGGPRVAEFEARFGELLGGQKVVGVNSCTNALHLALRAFGVAKRTENPWTVITTPLSFVATSNAALYQGITPTFVDVDPKTGLIDLDQVEEVANKFNRRNIAVMPVHLYGQMVDMRRLRSIFNGHGPNVIIEDAAHCIDGFRDGYRPGQMSDAACFSFHALKTMTSGDGGAIALQNPEKAKLMAMLRSHGMSKSAAERQSDYSVPDMTELGYKYNLSDIQAALLLPQIPLAEAGRLRREALDREYREAFKSVPEIGLLEEQTGTSSFSQFIILVNPAKRLAIINAIRAAGVEVIASYPAIHLMTFYRKIFPFVPGMHPHAERLGRSSISLPIYYSMTAEEQEQVIQVVLKSVKSA